MLGDCGHRLVSMLQVTLDIYWSPYIVTLAIDWSPCVVTIVKDQSMVYLTNSFDINPKEQLAGILNAKSCKWNP